MVRRRKPKRNEIVIGVFLIVIGLAVVGFSFSDTSFPILPLGTLLDRECNFTLFHFGAVVPGDLECFQRYNSFGTDQLPFQLFLPLSVVDTSSPMILEYNFIPICPTTRVDCSEGDTRGVNGGLPDPCASFATDIVRLVLTDENGVIIGMGNGAAGQTPTDRNPLDIQPLLLPNQNTLVVNFDDRGVGVCPTGEIQYSTSGLSGIRFLQDPPEITELSDPLLEQWIFLGDFRELGVVETATNFAVAETFQLDNPTVITELRVQIGTGSSSVNTDANTKFTAFVWDIDQSPAERIVQSAETVTGIAQSRAELILDFTFPTSVVLLPTQNNVPINYAVGIKVEQGTATSEFIYTKSDQFADTHKCIIDRTANPDVESSFVDNGLCGFDIRHSPFKAFTLLQSSEGTETEDQILDRLTEIENTILSTDDELTRTELTAILCEGITPQPAICQVGLTANSCGVTEFFFDGDCLCNAGYDRVESGDCELRDTSLLNIGEFTDEELVIIGIGLLILVIGAIAIAFARKR